MAGPLIGAKNETQDRDNNERDDDNNLNEISPNICLSCSFHSRRVFVRNSASGAVVRAATSALPRLPHPVVALSLEQGRGPKIRHQQRCLLKTLVSLGKTHRSTVRVAGARGQSHIHRRFPSMNTGH